MLCTILFAALTLLALGSCAKEIETADNNTSTPRVFTCSFEANDADTKTTAEIGNNTIKPKWAVGDKRK